MSDVEQVAKIYGVPVDTLEAVKAPAREFRVTGPLGTVRYFSDDRISEVLVKLFVCNTARQTTDAMITQQKLLDGEIITHNGWTVEPLNPDREDEEC